ncbi:Eukaryotic/viral aspartic protease [Phytophthora megakarya]|uniref:Eukaryotic/viral aspartic protease n=1 Tax=Phytophthora megakarya TaxID=4795 RepID=A0A225WBH9_9STRA|nr:Eukaryotic/viral aspartic protease [Phytophthora megakarya]
MNPTDILKHPTDCCLRAFKVCGGILEAGKCSLEEFFDRLRQWYDPQKYAGMLPPTAEMMWCSELQHRKQPGFRDQLAHDHSEKADFRP